MKKAIFFDMDGVLVDSVEGNFMSWQRVLQDVGLHVSLDELKLYEGMKSEIMIQELAIMNSFDLSLGEIMQMQREKRQIQNSYFTIEPYPIYEKLLAFKEQGIKLYVVSGSPRDRVLQGIENFFPGLFDGVITACDVQLGKPHPEPYLKAYEMSGFEIEECLIVENAPLGIKSGLNGGFEVVALGTTLQKEHLAEAHHYVDNHLELFDLIEEKILNENLLK